MVSQSQLFNKRGRWPEYAEDLLVMLPGVVSAKITGQESAVGEVRISYEPVRSIAEIGELVRLCLETETNAKLTRTRFRALLVPPSQRGDIPLPAPGSDPQPAEPSSVEAAAFRLVSYHTRGDEHGTPTVDVVLDFNGNTYRGSADLLKERPAGLFAPALATVRAMEACLGELYDGPGDPTLVLETALGVQVEDSDVAVVALRAMSEGASIPLTAASPIEGAAPALAVILATMRASSRIVTGWLAKGHAQSRRRFNLVDLAVQRSASGRTEIGVRLSTEGEAVMRRRRGEDTLELAAGVAVDAVCELLSRGAPGRRHDGALRHTGVSRIRMPGHDLAVVLVEALVNGMHVPFAGATHTGNGLERACVTAALQATNPFVAEVDWALGERMAAEA